MWVYFEPNAINRARESGLSGDQIRTALRKDDLSAVVGIHSIYELGRGHLNQKHAHTAQANFTIVHELNPNYSQPVRALHNAEILWYRTGTPVEWLLSGENLRRARREVHKLATGSFSKRARELIGTRESAIKKDIADDSLVRVEEARRFLDANRELAKKLRNFADVAAFFRPHFPEMIAALLEGVVSRAEAIDLAARLDEFPAIRSAHYSNLDLNFVRIAHLSQPGPDRLDDNRHLIEAAYCGLFVTDDRKLRQRGHGIHPDLRFVSWSELGLTG